MMGFWSDLGHLLSGGQVPALPQNDLEMPTQIIGGDGDGIVMAFGDAEYQRPKGYNSKEEAEEVAAQYRDRPGVANAKVMTFAGTTYVHVDEQRADGTLGDIVTVLPGGEGRVVMEPPEEKGPWWQIG